MFAAAHHRPRPVNAGQRRTPWYFYNLITLAAAASKGIWLLQGSGSECARHTTAVLTFEPQEFERMQLGLGDRVYP